MIIRKLLTIVIASLITINIANASNSNVNSACATLELMAKMTAINLLLPAGRDRMTELEQTQAQLLEMNRLACQPVMHTETTRFSSRYNNGRRVSDDLFNGAWYFPNGQMFVSRPGRDTTVYYPDGQVMAFRWMRGGQTLYWPNGNPATFSFRTVNEAWYYPDGHIITYLAGVKGARWFYPFARLDGQIGQEMISARWGEAGEYVYLLEFTGTHGAFIRRERIRDKLVLSDAELLDVPGVLLLITRLYQAQDLARQFIPGDGSIAGVPY